MANIRVRESMLGPVLGGFKGSVDLEPGLSWIDSLALQRLAANSDELAMSSWRTSAETRRAREVLESIDYSARDLADGLTSLEASLGLRLDGQTELLSQQAQTLEQIRDAVLSPAKVRGAERLDDASALLQRRRYSRALEVAEEGITADPRNPGLFMAAGWACMGLDRLDDAQNHFSEACDAASGDAASRAGRHAARVAFLASRTQVAADLASEARAAATSDAERAALDYDLAIYFAAMDRDAEASAAVRRACDHDSRFATMALVDPAFDSLPELREVAAESITGLGERIAASTADLTRRVGAAQAGLDEAMRAAPDHQHVPKKLKPESDWSERVARINADLDLAHVAVGAPISGPLQLALQDIGAASHAMSRAEADLEALPSDMDAERSAAATWGSLNDEGLAAEMEVRRFGGYMVRCYKILDRRRPFLLGGTFALLLGLFAGGALLALGVLLLAVPATAYLVLKWAEPKRNAAYQRTVEHARWMT